MTPRPRPVPDLTVVERPPDPETVLNRFRRRWPHWGFLHNPRSGEWTALRGRGVGEVTIVKADPVTLWSTLIEAEPGRPELLGTLTIPRTAERAGSARHQIQRLAEQSFGHAVASDIVIAAGELLANSIRHGAGPTTSIRVWTVGRRVRVEVSDSYAGPIEPASEDPYSETGRGLLMVQAVSDAWAIERTTGGTTAWFEKAIF